MSSSPPPALPVPIPVATPIRLAQATGILLATTTAGLGASLTFFAVPRLLALPAPALTRHFVSLISVTRLALPVPLLLPGLLHAWLAYRFSSSSAGPDARKARAYVLAAALSLSAAPWTWGVMMPMNWEMERQLRGVREVVDGDEEEVGVGEEEMGVGMGIGVEGKEETAHVLVGRWATLNLYRPSVAFLAECVGLYAALS
ncbi:hypothetical protein F5X99DRAFT_427199 [Biscogniauxia marginata]|nr:hypothetical protein F5X99DRAFT_427199 [Biscogniauxia marginata]